MSVFDRFSANRALSTIISAQEIDEPEVVQAIEKLRHVGAGSVPKLIQSLAGNPVSASILQRILAEHLDDSTLPLFIEALYHPQPEIGDRVAEVLKHSKKYDPDPLLNLFLDPESPKALVAEVLAARAKSVDGNAIIGLLSDVAPDTQRAVMQVIREVARPAMVPKLVRRLKHGGPTLREDLVHTLSRFSVPEVQTALTELMLEDPHKNVRLAALEGLVGLEAKTPVDILCKVLRDPDMTVQGKALEALVALRPPNITAHALALMKDKQEHVRRAAVELLNQLPDANAIDALVATLQDPDWWFRERAADALTTIGGDEVIQAVMARFDEDDEVLHETVVNILKRLGGGHTVDVLVGCLNAGSGSVQRGAIQALGEIGDQRAVPALVPLLQASPGLQDVVISALGTLGDPQAIPALLGSLETCEDAPRHQAMLEALEQVTDRANAPFVIERVRRLSRKRNDQVLSATAERTVFSLATRFDQTVPDTTGDPAPTPSALRLDPPSPATRVDLSSNADDDEPEAARDGDSDEQGRATAATPQASSPAAAPSSAQPLINPLDLRAGDRLADRYRVIRQVGRGGFGVVVLVEDEIVHERMILKFLSPHVAQDETVAKRFKHEIRYARSITHKNVIRIHDLVSFGDTFAISMEYFASHSLVSELQRFKQIPEARARTILMAICSGLEVAHRVGVIHRDLKPGNILIDDDLNVKIVDFGLAAAASQGASRLTRSGLVIGTPMYMAPEQIEGRVIDGRTDIYSLGILMYEMYTGIVPYEGENAMATLFKHLHGRCQEPRALNPDLSEPMEAIVTRAMSRDPADRFQSADALRLALEAAQPPPAS